MRPGTGGLESEVGIWGKQLDEGSGAQERQIWVREGVRGLCRPVSAVLRRWSPEKWWQKALVALQRRATESQLDGPRRPFRGPRGQEGRTP